MKKILLVLNLLIGTLSFSQSLTTTSNTDTLNCNGSAIIENTSLWNSWAWYISPGTLLQNGGDSIDSLCDGNYLVVGFDQQFNQDTLFFIIENDLSADCSGFSAQLANSNPYSVDGDCAGYLEAYPSGGAPPYSYSWSNQGTTALIDGLCAGSYNVTVTDTNACEVTISGMVYDSTSTQSSDTSFVINVNTTNVSADGVCDGNMQTSIVGGTAPYSFIHSGGETTANLTNLCAGFYTVTVIDVNGDSLSYSYLISSPETYYDNDTYVDSVVVDSVSSMLSEDCDINYQNVDSVYISSIEFPVADSAIVNWIVFYNGTQSTVITESYYLQSGNGTYVLELSLYCPNRATDNFLKATDQIYYTTDLIGATGVNGISELNDVNVNIYPNPFNEQITIQLSENGNYDVDVYDMSGKLLLSEKHNNSLITLNLNDLNQGQYLVKIQEDENIIIRKIVK
jgi:hypothetical protein